jgi:hypothetical protein
MFFIPGPMVAALTFPGVIIHEFGHLFFCKLFKLKVYDVCFFRFGNPAGYVVHETTDNFTRMWFVSMGPFFANTLLCMVFCTAAFLPVWVLKVEDLPAILSVPLIGLLYVLNFARVVWADLGYGIAVGILGPLAIFRALARA